MLYLYNRVLVKGMRMELDQGKYSFHPKKIRYLLLSLGSALCFFTSLEMQKEEEIAIFWIILLGLFTIRNISCLIPALVWTKTNSRGVLYKSFGTFFQTRIIPWEFIQKFSAEKHVAMADPIRRWIYQVSIVRIHFKEGYASSKIVPFKGLLNKYGDHILPHCGNAEEVADFLNKQLRHH